MDQNNQEKIIAFCEEKQLLAKGDGILIGLSGGADSVYLTYFLKSIQERYALRLYAVHVHHGIRGEAADADEAYAKKYAEQLGIPYESIHYDIPALAKQKGMSEEEAGRYYRYQCFRETAASRGCQKIAVAHHRDDQAETVLFQLLRGSGLRGLGGIRPCRDGIIRPLLVMSRQEIEQELTEAGISWREDASNRDVGYTRNKMRQQIIPYLQQEIQPQAVGHIAETAMQLQEAWDYLHRQARMAIDRLVHCEQDRVWFERTAFMQIDPALQSYILLELMEELAGSRKDLGKIHVEDWIQLIRGETGKRISLPYGLQAGRDYECIWLARMVRQEETKSGENAVVSGRLLQEGYQAEIDDLPGKVQMQCHPRAKLSEEIPKNNCTKWFDYAKIIVGFVWRHPMPGDYLVFDRQGHRKKLSRLLLEAKIPGEQRGQVWVLADGSHILWVPQIQRISMGYYVTPETEEVLVVHIEEERWNTL